MSLPYILANNPGNKPDAEKFMANYYWLLAMLKGSFISNGGFEGWAAATSFVNPADGAALADSWKLTKGGTSPASVNFAREATIKDSGSYSNKMSPTVAGSSNSYIRVYQDAPVPARFSSKTMVFGVMVKASVANKCRISVTDGVTESTGSYHSGDGTWQKLTVAITVSSAPVLMRVSIDMTTDFTGDVYVDSCFLYAIEAAMTLTAQQALEYFGPDQAGTITTGTVTLSEIIFVPQATAPALGVGVMYLDSTFNQLMISKDGLSWTVVA
jgi:hypothetical protein